MFAIVLGVAATVGTFAQSVPTPAPQFDVASIKPNDTGLEAWRFDTPEGRVVAINVTLQDLVRYAYSIFGSDSEGRIVAPEWIKASRFDIDAKTAPGTSQEGAMSMLRELLTERFRMKAHYETRAKPVYALTIARRDGRLGPQIKPNTTDCAAYIAALQARRARGDTTSSDGDDPICGNRGAPGHILASGDTMRDVATMLTGLGRPVFDETGLGTQRFDFELSWAPAQPGDTSAPVGPSIFTALEEQLGLKLVPKDAPLDVLVIDHIERPDPD